MSRRMGDGTSKARAAVAFSAWYGGLGPGVVATVVGALILSSCVLPPTSSLTIDSWDDVAILGVFALVALLISSLHAARWRAEASQREQREWFEVTLASIGDAVIATDARGRVTFINAVAESLTGWPSAEAVGKDLSEVFRIINMDTRQTVENPVAKVIRVGSVVGLANHTLLIAKDGTGRPIDDSGAPIRSRDGHLIGVVLVFRDVTERAHAEAVVRESEERYRQMFERNHAVKLLIDPNSGAIVDANPAAAEFYGYSLEELRHLRITDL
ncbi:MAG: PAS domain S-box protein, partial [Planctomycetaceae bacterium]